MKDFTSHWQFYVIPDLKTWSTHAAFQTLPGVVIPGDLGATARYFDADLTVPAYTAPDGIITLNAPGHETGIGCSLNVAAVAAVRQHRYVIE